MFDHRHATDDGAGHFPSLKKVKVGGCVFTMGIVYMC